MYSPIKLDLERSNTHALEPMEQAWRHRRAAQPLTQQWNEIETRQTAVIEPNNSSIRLRTQHTGRHVSQIKQLQNSGNRLSRVGWKINKIADNLATFCAQPEQPLQVSARIA
jgi:hypothetical protein